MILSLSLTLTQTHTHSLTFSCDGLHTLPRSTLKVRRPYLLSLLPGLTFAYVHTHTHSLSRFWQTFLILETFTVFWFSKLLIFSSYISLVYWKYYLIHSNIRAKTSWKKNVIRRENWVLLSSAGEVSSHKKNSSFMFAVVKGRRSQRKKNLEWDSKLKAGVLN